jgi:hypothetical protein
MTRDYLMSLGHTDEEIDGWYRKEFGGLPMLDSSKEDTYDLQRLRKIRFDQVMMAWQGISKPVNPNGPKMGSFAEDDAETHESFRERGSS